MFQWIVTFFKPHEVVKATFLSQTLAWVQGIIEIVATLISDLVATKEVHNGCCKTGARFGHMKIKYGLDGGSGVWLLN